MDQFLRMQELAGIRPISNNESILEGIKVFVNIFSSGLLTEAEEKDKTNSIIDSLTPEAIAFFKTLGITYDQLDSEGQKLLGDAFKEISQLGDKEKKDKLNTFKKSLSSKEVTEAEEESDYKGVDAIGKLGNWLRKNTLGKATKVAISALITASILVPNIVNFAKAVTPDKVQQVNKTITVTDKADLGNNAYFPAEKAKTDATEVKVKTSDGSLVIPFKLGKGNEQGIKDTKIVDNFINTLKAKYSDKSLSGEITIKLTGHGSHTGNALKSSTSDLPLNVERPETIKNIIEKETGGKIGNVKINIEVEKGNYQDLTKETGKNPTKGAVVTVDQLDSNIKQTKTDTKEIPDDLLPIFQPVKADYDPTVPDREETPSDEKTDATPSGGEATSTTSSKIKSYIDYFPNLNRNGQIAVILSIISPKTNIYSKLKSKQIRSFTDGELAKITNPKTKKIADLILNIRKNPDTLIKKLSAATNVKLNTRAKAVQTAPGQKYQPSSQLQNPIQERISLVSLLNEAMIDSVFSELGVTDDNIKTNRNYLLALVGSMYAQQGNTSLSILNAKDLTPEEQNQLKDLGFAPQGAKDEYVFLDAKSKGKQPTVNNFDKKSKTSVTKPDISRLDTYLNKQSSLKKQIAKIDTVAEFESTIKDVVNTLAKYNPQKFDKATQLRILNNVKSRLPNKLSEQTVNDLYKNVPADAAVLSKLFKNNNSFQSLVKNINDEEEAVQLILRVILKYTTNNLDLNEIKNTINRVILSLYKK